MRIFGGLKEAINEIERDLFEMGTLVHPESYQDQIVSDKDDFMTKEIQGYSYTITTSKIEDDFVELGGNIQYLEQELMDRMAVETRNPGNSYKLRPKVWEQFLHNGKFSYTYNERIGKQYLEVLDQLKKNPNTRQAVITLYDHHDDLKNMGGKARIPCSMYYQFLRRKREGKEYLDIIYTMRSCDFYTHLIYDIGLTMGICAWTAVVLGVEIGHFIHFIGSLHAYKRDYQKKGIF